VQEPLEAREVGQRLRVLDAQEITFELTAEDDEGFPASWGAREIEAEDPQASPFLAFGLRLPALAVLFPVQAMDVGLAVVFGDLLALVLAAGDVPFDHLVHLGAY
jgi:hypothetical protein